MPPREIFAEKPRRDVVPAEVERTLDPNVLENYLTDESALVIGRADEVVFLRTEEQISRIT